MISVPYNIVAISPLFDPDTSTGGIIIPDSAKERCDQGLVKYLGPKCKVLSIGDHVLFSPYSGTLIDIKGEGPLILIPENFIIATILEANTVVGGLYFKDEDGKTFPATYETAMQFMARAFENEEWFKNKHRDPKTGRPKDRKHSKTDTYTFAGYIDPDELEDE